MENQILLEIIADLADNYKNDLAVLQSILSDTITNALFLSNRKNTDDNIRILKSEIKKATKSIYLQRGGEGTTGLNENGTSSSFENALEVLEKDIVKNGKRRVY